MKNMSKGYSLSMKLFLLSLCLLISLSSIDRCLAQTSTQSPRPEVDEFSETFTKPRVEEQREVSKDYEEDVKKYLESGHSNIPPKSRIDRGYDAPKEFHKIDEDMIKGNYDECFDVGEIFPCCACPGVASAKGVATAILTGNPEAVFFHPLYEYWFPVSKVESVNVPFKTGYLEKKVVKEAIKQVDERYFKGANPLQKQYEDQALVRAKEALDTHGKKLIPGLEVPEKMPTISMKDFEAARSLGDESHYRVDMPGYGSFAEYHTMPEFFSRNKKYWEEFRACHYNLKEGEGPVGGSDNIPIGEMPPGIIIIDPFLPTPLPGGGGAPNATVKTERYLFSEWPDVYKLSRNAVEENKTLVGRDKLRAGMGYDHQGWFFNGGFISQYLKKRQENPFECMQAYMAGDKQGNPRLGRTPSDLLEPKISALSMKGINPELDVLKLGCMPKNGGQWVPTSNMTQSVYHTVSAAVSAMRGLKLAYWFHPPDSDCKGWPIIDSWGYCYNPITHGGYYYDFEPYPYTIQFASHAQTRDPDVFASGLFGLPLVSDKVQWTNSVNMPNHCQSLVKYFEEYEDRAEKIYPNKIEAPIDGQTDIQNVGIEWRFFRTCPKLVYQGRGYRRIPGTNTAECCGRCPCPGPCCCPPDKRL